jgi:Tol biopolymer transport system component
MLHESLRDLVAVRGAAVLYEAEEFRGALDDFLSEDEATLGELNLLVDAVRLGGLRRVLDVIDHGATPEAAIREAGVALARDRGTDDPTRSCWALAVLCFALGRTDVSLVRAYASQGGTLPVPGQQNTPYVGSPDPAGPGGVGPGTQFLGSNPPGGAAPTGAAPMPPPPPTPAGGHGRVPPVIPEQRSGRAGRYLLVVLAALVVGGLVAAGIILFRSGDDGRDGAGSNGGPGSLIAPDAILAAFTDDAGSSSIYAYDPETDEWDQLTDGPADRLPAISPDRSMVTYLDGPAGGATVLMALDPQTGEAERVFDDSGPCRYAARPGWSPDGSRLAVVCLDEDGDRLGIHVAEVGDDLPLEPSPEPVVPNTLTHESPTWVTDDSFIYAAFGDDDKLTSYLFSYTLGDAESRTLTDPDDGFLSHPDWSAEGRLLFVRHEEPGPGPGTLTSSDADVSAADELGETAVEDPVWSPDGTQVAFIVLDDGIPRLATADRDDLDGYTLVPDPPAGEIGAPAWGSR